ncbi:Uncharacterised protein [Klebsiella pneumoniae]|nr:Uncharacterised protein [Klebsiella pneumoniae]
MHEPPVQSDCCAFSVTINLSPTRKDTTYHHWQQPLVTHSQNKEVLKCEVNYSYTVRTNSVSVLCESQLPRFRNLPVNEPSKKPPCRVVFSFTGQEITTSEVGSQEIISSKRLKNLYILYNSYIYSPKPFICFYYFKINENPLTHINTTFKVQKIIMLEKNVTPRLPSYKTISPNMVVKVNKSFFHIITSQEATL